MKTLLLTLLAMLLSIDNLRAQVTLAKPQTMSNEELKCLLETLRGPESVGKESKLMLQAIDDALADLEKDDLSNKNAGILSRALLNSYALLGHTNFQDEPIGFFVRQACLVINQKMTKYVAPKVISRKDIQGLRIRAEALSFHSLEPIAYGLPDLRQASVIAVAVFESEDPELSFSTKEIYFLWQTANAVEAVGWDTSAKSLYVAAAAASGKLEYKEDWEDKKKPTQALSISVK